MRRLLQTVNPEVLQQFIKGKLQGTQFVIVSNRQPYMHFLQDGEIRWVPTVGGLTTALDPVMQAVGGTWVAHGSGEADPDVCDKKGQVAVPPDNPRYTLQRVWLSKEEEEGYYYGWANQALWPLCHNAFTRPVFLQSHWDAYRGVNQKFADQLAKVVGRKDAIIFVQDYHFALLPRMIKKKCPQAICAQFWHIPWPHPDVFSICPWKGKILDGLLGNDLIGFHLHTYCTNFLDTVDRELETRRDQERSAVIFRKNRTHVEPFPISVDFDAISRLAESEGCARRMESLTRELRLADKIVLVGIDRMDYTKGFPDRLRAVDLFLQRHPEYAGKLVLVQVAAPSREHIPQYKALIGEVQSLTEEINWRHRNGRWAPIVTINRGLPQEEVVALFRLADVCVVSSLQDGMNLVAKEFVSARSDLQGVLLLSRFAGAAQEMREALMFNPYAVDAFTEQILAAIKMGAPEQKRRMRALRRTVRQNNIYTWTMNILDRLSSLR